MGAVVDAIVPRTPASSKHSLAAASAALSSVSHPPFGKIKSRPSPLPLGPFFEFIINTLVDDDVDVVVFGHWHEAVITQVDGVLVMSPGAVCPWGSLHGGRVPGRGLAGIADRVVRRYRRQLGDQAMRPAVGILKVGDGPIRAEVVRIDV